MEKAYKVIYDNHGITKNMQHEKEFDNLEDAMFCAERKHQIGWDYVKVVDYFGGIIVEFEN